VDHKNTSLFSYWVDYFAGFKTPGSLEKINFWEVYFWNEFAEENEPK
jgi:hypothetical protein